MKVEDTEAALRQARQRPQAIILLVAGAEDCEDPRCIAEPVALGRLDRDDAFNQGDDAGHERNDPAEQYPRDPFRGVFVCLNILVPCGEPANAEDGRAAMITSAAQMMPRMPEIFKTFLLVSNDIFNFCRFLAVCYVSEGVCASPTAGVYSATVAIPQYFAAFFFAFTKTTTSNTMIRTAASIARTSPNIS